MGGLDWYGRVGSGWVPFLVCSCVFCLDWVGVGLGWVGLLFIIAIAKSSLSLAFSVCCFRLMLCYVLVSCAVWLSTLKYLVSY